MSRVAAVVLAAGASSRMGRPKQLLTWRGRSLLRIAIDAAVDGRCDPVVVVLGAEADTLRPELAGLAVTVAVNPDWPLGPGTSVRAGLVAAGDADAVVILACDQPLVDASHVRRLIEAHRTSGRPMAASGYAGSAGVPALFAHECYPDLRSLPAGSGAKQLLARRPDAVAIVPFAAAEIDVDTPEDYERFTREQAHGH